MEDLVHERAPLADSSERSPAQFGVRQSDFTPGPWKYSQESIDPEWFIVTIDGGLVIANVNAHWRQEANARLVSAAPELYQALQFIYEHIADPERTLRDLYPAFGLDGSRALAMARDALAKANGERAAHSTGQMTSPNEPESSAVSLNQDFPS